MLALIGTSTNWFGDDVKPAASGWQQQMPRDLDVDFATPLTIEKADPLVSIPVKRGDGISMTTGDYSPCRALNHAATAAAA